MRYKSIKIGPTNFTVEIAVDFQQQIKGLAGRVSMRPHNGLLFVYNTPAPKSFWMKGMYFPLDIILFNEEATVVSMLKDLPVPPIIGEPPNYSSGGVFIQYALEVNAGMSKNIQVGDLLIVIRDIPNKD